MIVAIADVAHYVTPGSELDREALKRGNSAYFPDRVVPMPGALIPVGVRPMLTLTLSCDHRVIDGARGAAFLHDVVEAIQQADKQFG